MTTFNNYIEINSNNISKIIEDNNLIEYYDKIINFLKINDDNLTKIKNKKGAPTGTEQKPAQDVKKPETNNPI